MASTDFVLSDTPDDSRTRELWLQHAAGFILMQDLREYAIQQMDPALNDEARAAAVKGIDDAVYGMMMVLDGVTGSLDNESRSISLRTQVELLDTEADEVIESLDLADGDGMCMGIHGWKEDDYGDPRPFHPE